MTETSDKIGEIGHKAFSGVIWSLLERCSTQIIGLVVTVIMTRMLLPADYGLIGMLLIFLEIGEAIASAGMTQAIMSRGMKDKADQSAAFIFNLVAGLIIYLGLYLAAPLIAEFYNEPVLEKLTRLVGVCVPLKACTCVADAHLMYFLAFRQRALTTFIAQVAAGIVGVASAAAGSGVWAIAYYMLVQAAFSLISINIAASMVKRGVPLNAGKPTFSIIRLLWNYGWKMIGARLADVAYINSYIILLGRFFPVADVGLFTRARQFASVPAISMNEIVRKVSYPVLCRYSDAPDLRACYFRKMVSITMSVAAPTMLTLAVLSHPAVKIVLGENWVEIAPLMTWLCLGTLWIPLDGLNLTLILATGSPDRLMKIEIIRKIIGLVVLIVSFSFGLTGICVGYAISGLITMAVTFVYAERTISGGAAMLLKSLLPILMVAGISAVAGGGMLLLFDSEAAQLIFGVSVACVVYLLLNKFLGHSELSYILRQLKILFHNTGSKPFLKYPADND